MGMEVIKDAILRGDYQKLETILSFVRNPLDDVKFTSFRRTPLHIAAMHGDVGLARSILRLSPHLASVVDSQGFTPLHLASTRSNLDMVSLLSDVNRDACTALDQDGRTPLHLAAMRDQTEVILELLICNPEAVFQVQNDRQETILHLCVKHNKLKALKMLVEYVVRKPGSISVNSRDINGDTILHLATERRQMKMVDYLVQSHDLGVDINVLNNKNLRALQLLAQNEMDDIEIGSFAYLVNKGVNQKTSSNKKGTNIERVNVLMVVAVLIAGIAFQAALNPPGGVFQEDSKVDSKTDPVTFTYYLKSVINTPVTARFGSYLRNFPQQATTKRNQGINTTTANNSASFIKALLNTTLNGYSHPYTSSIAPGLVLDEDSASFIKALLNTTLNGYSHPYTSSIAPGLVLDEDKWSNIVSHYNSSNGSIAGFYPYMIRYAGTAILAYKSPTNYKVYMASTSLALLLSLSLIILVVSGAIGDDSSSQVGFLSLLMLISIGCIIVSYVSVFQTISPPFHLSPPPFNLYVFTLSFCGMFWIALLYWKGVWIRSELYPRYLRHFNGGLYRSLSDLQLRGQQCDVFIKYWDEKRIVTRTVLLSGLFISIMFTATQILKVY